MLSTKQQTCIKMKDARALYPVAFQSKSSFSLCSLCYVNLSTSLLGPSQRHCGQVTQILLKKYRIGDELFVELCPI